MPNMRSFLNNSTPKSSEDSISSCEQADDCLSLQEPWTYWRIEGTEHPGKLTYLRPIYLKQVSSMNSNWSPTRGAKSTAPDPQPKNFKLG